MTGALSEKLRDVINREEARLRRMTEAEAAARPAPGAWSRIEVLGHLVDSAVNNLQRFVRAQLGAELVFPGYAQNEWVSIQGFAQEEWASLVTLWAALNRHVSHVVSRIPAAKLSTPCIIGGGKPVTLGFLAEDYLRHLEHHLAQIP